MNIQDDTQTPGHSFLFWLIVPALVVWFAAGYVRASFAGDEPIGSKDSSESIDNVSIFTRDYPPLPAGDNGYVTLWFDDGWLSQYRVAAPLLDKYGYKGTIAIPTKAVESPGYINWAQVKNLQDDGWEITNHSQVHDCKMQFHTQTQIKNELLRASLTLWSKKLTSDIFVSPCGVDSPTLSQEARKMFKAYRTVAPGINDMSNINNYLLKVKNIDAKTTQQELKDSLETAKQSRNWLILVFHKVGEEGSSMEDETYNIKLDDFESLLSEIENKGLSVITPSQVLNKI